MKLSKILPKFLINKYNEWQFKKKALPLYMYSFKKFCKAISQRNCEETIIGDLTLSFHTIEKGFTMPEFRSGFAISKLNSYIKRANCYVQKFGTNNIQIKHIAETVSDYKRLHQSLSYELPNDLVNEIDSFLSNFSDLNNEEIQIETTKEAYFSHNKDDFFHFSSSRHSCRTFTGETVDLDKIINSISLAQNAPSACNRQPTRIIVVTDKAKISEVFALHGGNRGFGHNVDKLIVVCGYLGCYGVAERDCVYIDCGIFTMNLSYALHYNKVAHCILNWSVNNEKDQTVRQILSIPDKQAVVSLIACGEVPEAFRLCRSGKKSVNSILRII